MKFLMYSECGEGAGVLKRIEQEGNDVALYIHDKIYKDVWTGLINKVTNPESFLDSNTVVLFDMSGNGGIADAWRRSGHMIYGASSLQDQLENDREFGFKVMKECGIQIPNMKSFKNFSEGIKYVQETNERLVFKPNGSMPCKLTYCAKDSIELVAYLKFVEKRFGKMIDDFILQEFIEGEVISSEAFCSGNSFLRPLNHTVEVKKSMNDELGPSTGCSGNTTWGTSGTCITAEGIELVEDWCVKNNYVGQLDLNAVVNEKGVFGLEWTPRWGYDATPTLLSLLYEDLGSFFYKLCKGEQKEIKISSDYGSAVRFTVPPYPAEPKKGVDSEKFSPNEGVPVLNWEDYDEEIYFYEVMCEDGQLVHSSGTGVIGLALGQGEDVKESLSAPYKILKDLTVPDMQYRTDLDTVLSSMVKEIESMPDVEVVNQEDDLELLNSVLPDEDEVDATTSTEEEEEEEKEEETTDDEDEGPLKTTYSSVKEQFPEFFKKFPELKEKFFKETKYAELFPTVEDAKEAIDDIDAYTNLRESAFSGNPELIVDSLRESDKTAFTTFSRNFLPTLYKKDPEVYEDCITPILQNVVQHIYKEATTRIGRGDKEGGEALQAAVRLFATSLFGDVGNDIATGSKTLIKPIPKVADDEKVGVAFSGALSTVTSDIDKSLRNTIRKGLDPKELLTPYVRKNVIAEVVSKINSQLEHDTQWMKSQAARWQRAKREGFSDGSKRKIINAYLARAQALVPTIRRTVVEEAMGVRRRGAEGKVRDIKDRTPSSKEVVNGRTPRSGAPALDSTKRIDYSKTSDEDILNGKITYK